MTFFSKLNEVLQKKDDGMTNADFLATYKSFNLDKTKIPKWSKYKENIIKAASDIKKKKLFKIRLSVKYQALYIELYTQFTEARSKGYHVDFNWLWSRGRKIHYNQTGDETAISRKHVIANFLRRNNLKRRKIQQDKKLPKEHYRADFLKWHYTLESRTIVSLRLLIFRFFSTQGIFIPTPPIINFQSFLLTFLSVKSHFHHSPS